MNQTRILQLNTQEFNGKAVIYVMSRDQRAEDNHALLIAQEEAIKHEVPLYVLFNLKIITSRSREHYEFMMTGIEQVAAKLESLDIPFIMREGESSENIAALIKETQAGSLYFDFSPLIANRTLAKKVAQDNAINVSVVDTHNIIPAWVASTKQEFAAHTMRRKVHKELEHYVLEPGQVKKHLHKSPGEIATVSFKDAWNFIAKIPSNGITITAVPGEKAAANHLTDFINEHLDTYALKRNDIANDQQSGLSPYLHFGQLSSLRVALEVFKHTDREPLLFQEVRLASAGEGPSEYDGMNALFEEMIVRKELSDNFCLYQKNYTSIKGAPEWAQQSLDLHRTDIREFVYTREQWEKAQTHDQAWNAAQNQLLKTGKIHGYMRMYWAKKMLEWSETPEQAIADCIYLNDTYSIDGGDPNGYVGILWSIAGLHDRPWFEREVFGKIRYMNEGGLKRKFDLAAYQQTWNN